MAVGSDCRPLFQRASAVGFCPNFEVRESKHNNDYYCNLSVPLTNDSGNGQIADLDSGAGLFAAVGGPLFAGNLRQLGKREEANAEIRF